MENIFRNKNILVTGGVGSVGSEIVRQLVKYSPATVRVFDHNEQRLFEIQSLFPHQKIIRPFLGDVRDIERLRKAMTDADIVFHAAALKHVEISEYNPFESVKTNISGTKNVIDAALAEVVDRVVVISTDKAVNPVSTMGATKLVSEKLTVAAYYHKGTKKTKFGVVRFGNVIVSSGSVIPTWIDQIKKGGPLTITDTEMTRFMMSSQQAVTLVFEAATKMRDGEIFILKMPALRMTDLAEVLIESLAPLFGFQPQEIKLQTIGMRAGEKLHEELVTKEEAYNLYETKSMFVVVPKKEIVNLKMKTIRYWSKKVALLTEYSSRVQKPLTKRQIKAMLKQAGVLF